MKKVFLFLCITFCINTVAHQKWNAKEFPPEMAHQPTPLPDRVVLTWNDNPSEIKIILKIRIFQFLEVVTQL